MQCPDVIIILAVRSSLYCFLYFHILEPCITVAYTDLLTQDDLVEVNCTIDEPVGVPLFSIGYERTASKNIPILAKWKAVNHIQTRRQWLYTTVLRVPKEGMIICQVTDTLGLYTKRMPIRITGMLFALLAKSIARK